MFAKSQQVFREVCNGMNSIDEHVKKTEIQLPSDARNHGAWREKKQLMFYLGIKYTFDFVMALFLGIVALLPLLLIALCIKLDSPGPALFTQTRIGQNGKRFKVYKFRTMDPSAPANLATAKFSDADKYMTPLGCFLRKTSLDELPQLLNVLKGEMSFVGFRPVCISECELNDLREQYGVFVCRPGITGLAQIRGRDDLHYIEKAKIDAEYVHNRSIWLDLYCLMKTVPVTLSQKGVK